MIFNLLPQPAWLDYSHLYVFGKRLHQQEYKVLGMLASLAACAIPLAARVLPTILSGLTTGLRSGGINKAISGSDAAVGDGLYLHKHQ